MGFQTDATLMALLANQITREWGSSNPTATSNYQFGIQSKWI